MAAVGAVEVKLGASLRLLTVMVNDCDDESPIESVTRKSMLGVTPTSAFSGVPLSVAVPLPLSVSVNQPGSVETLVMVTTSPPSGSVVVME